MNLRYIQDPGHGWLEVPKTQLAELGIADRITQYSYVRGQLAYLEEDLDMYTFMQAAREQGLDITLTEVYQEHTPIRGYDRYFGLAA
jgi:hypothetical protein